MAPVEFLDERPWCCCHRYQLEPGEDYRHNDTVHQLPGEGKFCGPVIHHRVAELESALRECRACIEDGKPSHALDVIDKLFPHTDPTPLRLGRARGTAPPPPRRMGRS